MLHWVICGIFLIVPFVQSALLTDHLKSNLIQIVTKCQEKSGASMVDLQTIKSRKLPKTETGLCLLDCIFNEVKIMKDGKLNRNGLIAVVTPLAKGNLTKINQIKELADFCDKAVGKGSTKKCENVKLLLECVGDHGKEYGLDIPSSTKM